MGKPQYNPKNFFRQASNTLLQSYFHERGLLIRLDIASLDESDVGLIYEAWSDLPATERAQTDEDFQIIDSLADEAGILLLLEESRARGNDAEAVFGRLPGFHDKSLWAFLYLNECIDSALRFREADDLSQTYWKDRNGIANFTPRTNEAGCTDLANVLKLYFRQREGRG